MFENFVAEQIVRELNLLRDRIDRLEAVEGFVVHNLGAAAAPTANDDAGDGYIPGSIWVDTANDSAYICLDSTSGAAVWKKITP